ncbi:glycoside hydrolase family 3 protein [Alteraurantiacibacter aquimixticola]|uniref:Glycoside hydrolase family 3 protein n=1 Tax=Alteraurantiacibacter aquimixticola TaxID=2489173 RepID=A0A4T3F7L7_9SPHN|nr:glycoside hydrolase family 3 N-terminal domain-containing protein [Alteraurantiacibacter aquimixticola]TIX50980.1 glycoside hydrolase family 3 protein [Alteraurantiacibacter aquimixticola]
MSRLGKAASTGLATVLLTACATAPMGDIANAETSATTAATAPVAADAPGTAHPEIWPAYDYPVATAPAVEARVAAILARMTLEEKIGQLVQADICCVTPGEVREYNLGSVLNGGNSGPYGNDLAPASDWLKLADEFWEASTYTEDGGVGVPVVWGTDAVHGHSNIIGATIFPHNIGLGAMRDVDVIERIGAATAREIRVTGQEWTFAPTVAVPQDFRWGRAYEGYSSDPALVSSYVGAMVRGLQGGPDNHDLLSGPYVIASTKHYLADGGTDGGTDQGDSSVSEEELRDIHGAPYGPAIAEGVATVMASFSSWQGVKMTGNHSLLTEVLKERMDFGGFTVSDWNAHGQVAGCTNESCPQALMAGIDMYMAPDTWRPIYEDLLFRAQRGEIPMSRIDEAVTNILVVKARLGLLDAPRPSERLLSGEYDVLGAPEHRALAREAVRKSLVLLRNDGVLPIAPGGRLLVAGDGADDIARQSGGWTLTWQGTGLTNDHFPNGSSIWDGLRDAVEAGGGSAELSEDGSFYQRPDAAVVVFGEQPYAEFQGDRATLALDSALTGPYATMQSLREQGIPVVAVMITGRPLYVNEALNNSDAFVVAWLPGSEGAGVADVLVGDGAGAARHDFTGRLPADWPMTPDMADGALWNFGDGLSYASAPVAWTDLPLVETGNAADSRVWFADGVPAAAWSLHIVDPSQPGSQTRITTTPAEALDGRAQITAVNHVVQEGARRFDIASGEAAISVSSFEPLDLTRETNADIMLLFTVRVDEAPEWTGIAMRGAGGDMQVSTALLPANGAFTRYGIELSCLADKGIDMSAVSAPFILATEGGGDISLAEVRLGMDAEVILPCS